VRQCQVFPGSAILRYAWPTTGLENKCSNSHYLSAFVDAAVSGAAGLVRTVAPAAASGNGALNATAFGKFLDPACSDRFWPMADAHGWLRPTQRRLRRLLKADIRGGWDSLRSGMLTAGETAFVLPMTYAAAPLSVLLFGVDIPNNGRVGYPPGGSIRNTAGDE
jgi:hypothetical protein